MAEDVSYDKGNLFESSMDKAYPRPSDYEDGKLKIPERPDKSPFPSPFNRTGIK